MISQLLGRLSQPKGAGLGLLCLTCSAELCPCSSSGRSAFSIISYFIILPRNLPIPKIFPHPPRYFSTPLSIFQSIHSPLILFIHPVNTCLPHTQLCIHSYIHPSTCPSICQLVHPSTHLSICPLSIHLSVHPSSHLSTRPSIPRLDA